MEKDCSGINILNLTQCIEAKLKANGSTGLGLYKTTNNTEILGWTFETLDARGVE